MDRNYPWVWTGGLSYVALRKESVDRNWFRRLCGVQLQVALRKESVDRNDTVQIVVVIVHASLSARRAWIEMVSY